MNRYYFEDVKELEQEEMTLEDLKKCLERMETINFFLEMKDHWSHDDFTLSYKYHDVITYLKKKIKELEV
jgi:uncharacterized protein YneR